MCTCRIHIEILPAISPSLPGQFPVYVLFIFVSRMYMYTYIHIYTYIYIHL